MLYFAINYSNLIVTTSEKCMDVVNITWLEFVISWFARGSQPELAK